MHGCFNEHQIITFILFTTANFNKSVTDSIIKEIIFMLSSDWLFLCGIKIRFIDVDFTRAFLSYLLWTPVSGRSDMFLDALSHLYKRVCLSVYLSVLWYVRYASYIALMTHLVARPVLLN